MLEDSFALKRIALSVGMLVWLAFIGIDLLILAGPPLWGVLAVRLGVLVLLLVCGCLIMLRRHPADGAAEHRLRPRPWRRCGGGGRPGAPGRSRLSLKACCWSVSPPISSPACVCRGIELRAGRAARLPGLRVVGGGPGTAGLQPVVPAVRQPDRRGRLLPAGVQVARAFPHQPSAAGDGGSTA